MNKNYIALLYSFLEKKRASALMEEYKKLGFSGGTFTFGNGAATNVLWRLVGFDGPERAVLINLIDENMLGEYLKNEGTIKDKIYFQSAVVPLNNEAVSNALLKEGIVMSNLSFIQVICNKGFALEIMEKARTLGAEGGTILQGRGTAREEDEVFFGNKLVKEKEILLIIVNSDVASKVVDGIENMDCMKEDGAGIVYTLPISYFSKNKKLNEKTDK